jgi:Tfp pilus assembly protein PilO
VAAACAALPVATYWLLFRPGTERALQARQVRLDNGKKTIHALEVTANKLEEFKRENAELDGGLSGMEQIRPREAQLTPLLERLRSAATSSGAILLEEKPLPEGDERVRFELRLRGTPAAIQAFVERLPRLARLVVVDRIEMERRGAKDFDFTVRLSAFRLKG